VMPGRHYTSSTMYRYDYQGIEKEQETNWNNFELRMYDANLGRWMSPDPYGEFFSPYLAMGNNPVSTVDPDGGKVARSGTGAGFDADYSGRERHVDPFDMVGGGGTREEHYLKTKDGNLISLDEEGPYSVGEQLRGFGYYAAGTGSTAQSTQISTYTFNVHIKGSEEVHGSFDLSFDRNGKMISNMPSGQGEGGAGGTDLVGFGWAITGAGLTAGEVKMFNKESWFSVKQWKTYGQNFNGNGYTGGKITSAKTISNTFKWAGRGLGAYSAYSTNQQFQNGEISFQRMILDQASNVYSTFGGIYGAAWGVGWEAGRGITQMGWYQQWKQDVWYPWREEHLGY
ncbi:MAG: hypothetical protein K9I48_06815, partial [Sphingobacteriales bacterium]|nr:hypothetical protein [Sphingobacteriales bacterium]